MILAFGLRFRTNMRQLRNIPFNLKNVQGLVVSCWVYSLMEGIGPSTWRLRVEFYQSIIGTSTYHPVRILRNTRDL